MTARTSAQALFRVFVTPLLSSPAPSLPLHRSVISSRKVPTSLRSTCQPSRRIHAYAIPKKDTDDPFNDPNHPIDEAIKARYVHSVNEEGKLQRNVALRELLSSIDRSTQHVRQMSKDDSGTPVVKIVLAKEIREASNLRKQLKARKTQDDLTKQIELSWNTTANDAGFKLKQMCQFIEAGRRVEVVITPKVKGRKVSLERTAQKQDMVELMESVYDRVDSIEGAEEWRDMEGSIGSTVTLFFRLNPNTVAGQAAAGNKGKLKDIAAARQQKMKAKEEEKAAKKAQQEERQKRKAERDKSRFQSPNGAQLS